MAAIVSYNGKVDNFDLKNYYLIAEFNDRPYKFYNTILTSCIYLLDENINELHEFQPEAGFITDTKNKELCRSY